MEALRAVLFSLLIGFHNALEQDDRGADERRVPRIERRYWVEPEGVSPARCFFWAESSLLN
ncbi:MAG: hypothetical protein R2817_03730 [Flavobacteriales bacterium]